MEYPDLINLIEIVKGSSYSEDEYQLSGVTQCILLTALWGRLY
jgi:hypothetical protein